MKEKFYIKPASKGATKVGERNDCVVRAITNVTGMDYDYIHSVLKKHGRNDGQGTFANTSVKAMQELGFKPVVIGKSHWKYYVKDCEANPKKTLNQVMNDLPAGKFVVYVNLHATALVNGQIVDTFEQGKKKPVHVIWYHPELSFS